VQRPNILYIHSHIHVFPTVCDIVGIAQPAWLQGKSMLPLVRGEADEINEAVFAEVTFYAAFEPKRAVRTSRRKYIRNYDERRRSVLPNCDDSPSKDFWLASGWQEQVVPVEELYDLLFDPGETHNLSADASPTHLSTGCWVRCAAVLSAGCRTPVIRCCWTRFPYCPN
jgi:arylsulfatase A-like enzyme